MKKFGIILACFVASVLVVMLPMFFQKETMGAETFLNEASSFHQKVLTYTKEPVLQHKLYHNEELIAIIQDVNYINAKMNQLYKEKFEKDFPNTRVALGRDVYLVDDYGYYTTENLDDEIFEYMYENDMMGIEANSIEFSTRDGIYDIIYIDDMQHFYEARDRFLLNFVSKETLLRFQSGERVDSISDFGELEVGMRIAETITSKRAVAHTDEIFTTTGEVYEFLCYGRNKERVYHTVQEGETLQGVGFSYNNMSPLQIMLLNPDKIYNVNQVLVPGMELNVTYFSSPISVYVTKERLVEEIIFPEAPVYIEDPDMYVDETRLVASESNGTKNVLYEEIWVNGTLQSGVVRSSKTTLEAVQGVIAVGTMAIPNVGTGNFIWPVDNPRKTCAWGCYPGHQAQDIESMYDRWGNVYAADNGTVIDVSYDSIGGNHITIDHNNGYKTYYGHFSAPAFPAVGDTVRRGQVIGKIGRTGVATGPHVHYAIYVNDQLVDPCTVVNCNSIP